MSISRAKGLINLMFNYIISVNEVTLNSVSRMKLVYFSLTSPILLITKEAQVWSSCHVYYTMLFLSYILIFW